MKVLALLLLLLTTSLYGEKQRSIRYVIHDLGVAENIHELPPPRLNNGGIVIANRDEGPFSWKKNQQEFSPKVNDGSVRFHAINTSGDVLVSILRSDKSVEWAVWPSAGQCEENQRQVLETRGYKKKSKKMCLYDLSDGKVAAGCFFDRHGEPHALILRNGGLESRGIYRGLTSSGTLYGFLWKETEMVPAIRSESDEITTMKNYRSKVVPEGVIKLETLAMNNEGVAYGTYWVEYKDANPVVLGIPKVYYNFAWKPSTSEFKLIDIDGMRITKVNSLHTLIGELNEKPAICEAGKKPVEMGKLLDSDQGKEWEILKITDLNDRNDLVGIAKYQGKTHLFFAEADTNHH